MTPGREFEAAEVVVDRGDGGGPRLYGASQRWVCSVAERERSRLRRWTWMARVGREESQGVQG